MELVIILIAIAVLVVAGLGTTFLVIPRGRLTRLRGRLAASRGGFGSALLNLLSRDTLDDQAWEDIEDTLITADMGVAPSRQITEELRTQVKVTGTRDPDQVRTMLRTELIGQIG